MYTLLIDDVRDLNTDIVARTFNAGVEILRSIDTITELYLDNDLGLNQKEGWEILRLAIWEHILPPKVQLVTSNPVAREKMAADLLAAGYEYKFNTQMWVLK